MIYSKFGTQLTLTSKTADAGGQVLVQATTDGTADTRDYKITDLTADDGLTEIKAAVAKLPVKILQSRIGRPQRPL